VPISAQGYKLSRQAQCRIDIIPALRQQSCARDAFALDGVVAHQTRFKAPSGPGMNAEGVVEKFPNAVGLQSLSAALALRLRRINSLVAIPASQFVAIEIQRFHCSLAAADENVLVPSEADSRALQLKCLDTTTTKIECRLIPG